MEDVVDFTGVEGVGDECDVLCSEEYGSFGRGSESRRINRSGNEGEEDMDVRQKGGGFDRSSVMSEHFTPPETDPPRRLRHGGVNVLSPGGSDGGDANILMVLGSSSCVSQTYTRARARR